MNESQQEPSSISWEKIENSARSDQVLALGRKLVDELALEDSTDTLGRWMAHYLAGLITKAENAKGSDKSIAEQKCFEAVLALWKHRSELPSGKRPFQELEPVIKAVESLDPETEVPRYFRTARPPKDEVPETSEQAKWLDRANTLDLSAKVLIGFCLAEAAGAAHDKSKEWVKLAEAISGDGGAPEFVIQFISRAMDVAKEPDINSTLRELLNDKIERLREFIRTAETIADVIKARREALPPATLNHCTE
jgi:uncharacterized protein YgfB (UPF0149 family)